MIRLLKPEVVIFTGAGGKAFCAGGDIKSLYDAKKSGTNQEILDKFFREEYVLDLELANMKPIQVAFWDGIVMGGGVGISIHAPIKIATENSMFAMPEAKIGLFSDVGGGYFLSRLRNNLGYYFGLTGSRLKGQELVQTGIADFFVKREKLQSLEQEIIESASPNTKLEDLKSIVKKYEDPVERKYPNEELINKIFGKESVEEIYQALKESTENAEFTQKLASIMDSQSPLSMKIIHEQIKRGRNLDLKENLQMDMRIVTRFMEGEEFFEGVRCTLVDKTDKPKWAHKSVNEVSKNEVERYFAKLSDNLEL